MIDSMSFSELSVTAHSLYQTILKSTHTNDHTDNVNTCIDLLNKLISRTQLNALFSSNETLEDISTVSLKYLLLHYYVSNLYLNYIRTSAEQYLQRIKYINYAIKHIEQFMALLHNYKLVDKTNYSHYKTYLQGYNTIMRSKYDNDTTFDRNSHSNNHASTKLDDIMNKLSSNITRDDKIKQYKHEKQLSEKLSMIDDKRGRAAKVNNNTDTYNDSEYDDNEREYVLLLVEQSVIKVVNDMRYAVQELLMLMNKTTIEEINAIDDELDRLNLSNYDNITTATPSTRLGESSGNTPLSASLITGGNNALNNASFSAQPPKIYQIGSSNDLNKPIPPHMQSFMQHVAAPHQPVSQQLPLQHNTTAAQQNDINQSIIQQIQSNTTNNIVKSAENAIQNRQNIISTAFIDRNPATILPEQWAEQQIRDGLLPAAPIQQKSMDVNYVHTSSNNTNIDALSSDEDTDDLNDIQHNRKQLEAREWDNWKDDHERGAGARKFKQGQR